jgi:hypothetical protein
MIDARQCGEDCWNRDAIDAYVQTVEEKEIRLGTNPDIEVIAGKLTCSNCVVNEGGNGTMCTLQVTETQFAVRGERAPPRGGCICGRQSN